MPGSGGVPVLVSIACAPSIVGAVKAATAAVEMTILIVSP